jgi:UDP-2,3-diacylglucosamine pyrophosphatase LpxH
MRRLLQIILLKPILWASNKFSSKPQRDKIFEALSLLQKNIQENEEKKGLKILVKKEDKFIVLSDQHCGAKDGADDFMNAEPNYLTALDYYFENRFFFISLGDSEELWENSLSSVKKNNTETFEAEKKFIQENRFYKVFGNHDLFWANDPLASWQLKRIYDQEVNIYEGLILELTIKHSPLTIFMTHGHQGDASSDGNWFSKFFVANIWAPLQAFLKINPNTPAYDEGMKSEHNHIMYDWSAEQKNLLLITGHTHQPVFESLTHPERLLSEIRMARDIKDEVRLRELETELKSIVKNKKYFHPDFLKMKPSYFNSGCCCFNYGDFTGIEITAENISLIKWSSDKGREILEKASFSTLIDQLN